MKLHWDDFPTRDQLCPEAELRAALGDAEFWDHVLNGPGSGPDDAHDEDAYDEDAYDAEYKPITDQPCPECGEVGPCGYDPEGRPLIHPIASEVDA